MAIKEGSCEESLLGEVEEVIEKVKDVRNVLQLLEMSLQINEDDGHVARSVTVIDKMLASVLEQDLALLREKVYGQSSKG